MMQSLKKPKKSCENWKKKNKRRLTDRGRSKLLNSNRNVYSKNKTSKNFKITNLKDLTLCRRLMPSKGHKFKLDKLLSLWSKHQSQKSQMKVTMRTTSADVLIQRQCKVGASTAVSGLVGLFCVALSELAK